MMNTHPNHNSFRISELPSSQSGVTSVKPDRPLSEATSIMMMRDYSQLPVMTTEREVIGTVSWKSIGVHFQLKGDGLLAEDCMDRNYSEVSLDENLLKTVRTILKEEFVLVRDETKKVCGICTLADVGLRFLEHAKPFIEIEQIELSIRNWLREKADLEFFSKPLQEGPATRKISRISDLSFGDYVRWFEYPENWMKLNQKIDRKVFIEELRKVNQIRNRLMHFRHDEISVDDKMTLQNVSRFFRLLTRLVQSPPPSQPQA